MLETGQVLDRYRVDSELGSGGVATVYKVVHTRLGSEHALKVVTVPTELQKARLLQEGRTQACIRHPNLVTVTDVLELGGSPALVMEYVNGPSLDEWLEDNTPDLSQALQLFAGIVRGVGAAHAAGLVHRDLKPSNILLAQTVDGLVPKVTDFGLVKNGKESGGASLTQPGLMGTPQYMAPEQINEEEDDQRADMFALGCILYELVCGQRAFDTEDHIQAYNRILAGEYTPPEQVNHRLPPMVTSAIRRLLRTDPKTRPANCDVLVAMLYGTSASGQTFDSGDSLHAEGTLTPTGPSFTVTPIISRRRGHSTPHPASPGPTPAPPAPRTARTARHLSWALGGIAVLFAITAIAVVAYMAGGLTQTAPAPTAQILLPGTAATQPDAAQDDAPTEPEAMPTLDAAEPIEPEPAQVVQVPPQAAPKSSFSVTGDASAVALVNANGSYPVGAVPPGTYEIRATFAGKQVNAGSVKVRSGQSVQLACSSFMMLCKVQ